MVNARPVARMRNDKDWWRYVLSLTDCQSSLVDSAERL